MRISRVLITFLGLSACACLADDSALQVQTFADHDSNQHFSLRINPDGKIFGNGAQPSIRGELKLNLPERGVRTYQPNKRTLNADDTCFYIRSYIVEREDANSDAVRPKRYSTCQPSSRFDLRNAVAPADGPH